MKKIISALTCAALLISALVFPAAAQKEYSLNTEQTAILRAMGIYDGTQNLGTEVTKGEFAKIIVDALYDGNVSALVPGTDSYFTDVDALTDNYAQIWLLKRSNAIAADINGRYNPDSVQNTNDALDTVLTVLGYTSTLSGIGAKDEALAMGLTENVTSLDAELNYYNACMIMINIAKTDISSVPYFPYKKIYKTKGIVEDDGYMCANGRSTLGEENIMIGGTRLVNKTGEADLFGFAVTGYYKKDRDSGDLVLLSAVKNTQNEVLTIKSNLIDSFDVQTKTYEYFESDYGNLKKTRIPTGAVIVYNGDVTDIEDTGFTADKFKPESGIVKLYDNDGDSDWDIVFIEDFETYIASYVDREKEIIYTKNNDVPIRLEECNYKITDRYGEETEFSDISENSVLSVAKNFKGDKYTVYVSKDSAQDMIVSIDSDEKTVDARMGGTYKFSEYFDKKTGFDKLRLKTLYTFWFDIFGEVAYVVATSDNSWNIGYMTKAWHDEDSPDGESYYVRLYEPGNKVLDLKLAEKVTIYDEEDFGAYEDEVNPGNAGTRTDKKRTYKDFEARDKIEEYCTLHSLNSAECNGIVRYKINAAGEVNVIEFPIDSEKYNVAPIDSDRLFIIKKDITTGIRYLNAVAFDGAVGVNDATKFVLVPSVKQTRDARFITLQKSAAVSHNERKKLVAYGTNTKTLMADYVVVASDSEVNFTYTNLMAVTKVTKVYEDEQTMYKIEGSIKNTNAAGFVNTEFCVSDLNVVDNATNIEGVPCKVSKGDVITYSKSPTDGYMNGIYVLYDAESNSIGSKNIIAFTNGTTEFSLSTLTSFSDAPRRTVLGYVYSYEDGNLIVTTQPINSRAYDTTDQAGTSSYKTEMYINPKNNIMYMNMKDSGVTAAWAEDINIKPYRTYGNDCSEILVLTAGQGLTMMVVLDKE